MQEGTGNGEHEIPAASAERPMAAIRVNVDGLAETQRLAEDLAMIVAPGDCLCLSGDLGAGKSTFARALIRALADDAELEVPSPTFTLVQSYELARFDVAHLDLYRLEEPEEIEELALEDALEIGIALVEWPEKADQFLPKGCLAISIEAADETDTRSFLLRSTDPAWHARIERTRAIRALLLNAGMGDAARRYLQGDASPRRYETVTSADRAAILMNAPALDVPAASDAGESYADIVHLAQDMHAVVAVGEALRSHGFSAPETLAADLPGGLLLQEDLGRGAIVEAGAPVPERYEAAVDLLADLHEAGIGPSLPLPGVPGGGSYQVPAYDARALMTEAELFLEWYLPWLGVTVTPAMRAEFADLWRPLFARVQEQAPVLALRDYHSPNLIWRGERHGNDRLGLVDYQDAVMGSPAYDLASLAMDARVTVPPALEASLIERYIAIRLARDPAFDADRLRGDYAIMAAQRAHKVLGVFVRLARRDGKPAYLAHLPRVRDYLARALTHPRLAPLASWLAGLEAGSDGSEVREHP
jgi:tRNA threonylcarbamoyl adenosine modification protein YjeE